ncbi:LD-carboxypeptidase [Rhizobium puerariae]|uniref:LD-carboxypeptidase n=1 Tax=Rhizobium puerariae TaxID=1585791 RepID=A0ABV6AQY3_9HYPH
MIVRRMPEDCIFPAGLKPGDKIRFISPASTPERLPVLARAESLRALGFEVDFGRHAFEKYGPFAGTDAQRLEDINDAFRDPAVRAIFATRGGKGSYRIADRLDFEAVRRDPKPLVGFSDITALHLSLFLHCRLVGVHGTLYGNGEGGFDAENLELLLRMLAGRGSLVFQARPDEATAVLTAGGAASGLLIGGNLDTIATAAGWALPGLQGAILLVEAADCQPGRIDRALTMLGKAGHLDGLAGVAVGQFTTADPERLPPVIDIVGDHLSRMAVPVLGGLPFGHGTRALSTPVGSTACIDAAAGTLTVFH